MDRTGVEGEGKRVDAGKRLARQRPWRALNATLRSYNFIPLATESWKQQSLREKFVGRWGDGRTRRHGNEGKDPQTKQMNDNLDYLPN